MSLAHGPAAVGGDAPWTKWSEELGAEGGEAGQPELIAALLATTLGAAVAAFPPGEDEGPVTAGTGWPPGGLPWAQIREAVESGEDLWDEGPPRHVLHARIEGATEELPGLLLAVATRPWLEGDRAAFRLAASAISRGFEDARALTRLRADAERLRVLSAALDQANDVVLICEAEPIEQPGPRVVYVNQAFTRLTGYDPEEIVGRTPRILQGPDTSRETLDEVRDRLAHWQPVRVELANYRKDGTKFWVELNIRPVADGNGWFTHWVSIQRDITSRKAREDELRRVAAEARRLAMVASRTHNAVIITDHMGRIEWVNEAFTAMCGYEPEEVLGRTPGEFLQGPETDAAEVARMRDQMRAGEGFQVELANYAKSGRMYYASLNVQPVHEGGELTNFIGIAIDVSDRRRIEMEVRDLNGRLEQRLRHAAATRRIDAAITSSVDLRLTVEVLLDQVVGELRPSAAAVLTCGEHDLSLELVAARGFLQPPSAGTRLGVEDSLAGRAVVGNLPVLIGDLGSVPEGTGCRLGTAADGFVAYQAVPLVAKGRVRGVLECYHRGAFHPDQDWLEAFEMLAAQAAIAVDNATLFEELRRSNMELALAYDATIVAWSRVMDLRDRETEGHSRRVAEMSVRLARRMGLPECRLVHLRRGALLHDIGKMGVPDAILLKPGPLDPDERRQMERHTELAEEMLRSIQFLRPAMDIPVAHHEKWDGTGYPKRLKGEEIPLEARIFAAIDIHDALTHDRPYRSAWPEPKVREHLRSLSGSHLDPDVVAAFLRMLEEDERGLA